MAPNTGTALSPPQGQRSLRQFLSWRRPHETDAQFGFRLAISLPLLFYIAFLLLMLAGRVDGEAGLGVTLAYWLFIGLAQLIYLIPAIGVAIWRRRSGVAKGLAIGGAIIGIVDVVAWVLGVYVVGVR
jgi:hypothetical protein